MKTKNIIFDWNEVFANGIYAAGKMGDLVEHELGLSRKDYAAKDNELNWPLCQELNRGKLTERAYWERMIQQNGWSLRPEQFAALTDSVIKHPIIGTTEIARELYDKGYRMILVSDVWQELKERILREYPWIPGMFDKVYWSCDYGRIKSDPDYFDFIINDADINPAESIFIDDYHVNTERAEQAGITSIVFNDAIQLRTILKILGIL
ncbi:HAD family phosphatase [Candidatus Saccharibacteria bacterium]|nr:HAD family phosphatase [Candidatus Saccharibacteria bacterium]